MYNLQEKEKMSPTQKLYLGIQTAFHILLISLTLAVSAINITSVNFPFLFAVDLCHVYGILTRMNNLSSRESTPHHPLYCVVLAIYTLSVCVIMMYKQSVCDRGSEMRYLWSVFGIEHFIWTHKQCGENPHQRKVFPDCCLF